MEQNTVDPYTTKETKEVLVFAFKLANVVKLAHADGKFDYNDIGLLFTIAPSMGPAFDNIALVPKELSHLTQAEIVDLETYLIKELGELIEKAKIMEQINAGLKMIHAMYEFYNTLK